MLDTKNDSHVRWSGMDDATVMWLGSNTVRTAMRQTNWVTTGNTLDLLEAILELTETKPKVDLTPALGAALDGFDPSRFEPKPGKLGSATRLVTLLRDYGVSDVAMLEAGLPQGALNIRHSRWRCAALKALIAGGTRDSIKAAVTEASGKEVLWNAIRKVGDAHGLDMTKYARPKGRQTRPGKREQTAA